MLAWAEDQMGYALVRVGRAREGLAHLRRARDLLTKTIGTGSAYYLKVGVEIAEADHLVGNTEEAADLIAQAETLGPKGFDSYDTLGSTLLEHAKLELERGRSDRARELAERAVTLLREAPALIPIASPTPTSSSRAPSRRGGRTCRGPRRWRKRRATVSPSWATGKARSKRRR